MLTSFHTPNHTASGKASAAMTHSGLIIVPQAPMRIVQFMRSAFSIFMEKSACARSRDSDRIQGAEPQRHLVLRELRVTEVAVCQYMVIILTYFQLPCGC